MKIYETGSVLFNVITKRFSNDYSITYNRFTDTITIENNDRFNYGKKLSFELKKEGITCLKEYIFLLSKTIKQLKEENSNLKTDSLSFNVRKNTFAFARVSAT